MKQIRNRYIDEEADEMESARPQHARLDSVLSIQKRSFSSQLQNPFRNKTFPPMVKAALSLSLS
jgi:hypothetical protein